MHDSAKIAHAKAAIDAYNAEGWDGWRKLHAPDVQYDEVSTGRRMSGQDDILEALRGWRAAFPDGRGEVTNAMVQGDTVVIEVTWTGTQTGEMVTPGGTLPPSGRSQTTRACLVSEFADGRIASNRHYFDVMSMMQQLGAIPS